MNELIKNLYRRKNKKQGEIITKGDILQILAKNKIQMDIVLTEIESMLDNGELTTGEGSPDALQRNFN